MEYPLLAAFLIGLFSTVHCLGMCGGITGVLTYSLPDPVRAAPGRMGLYLAAYNGGRIASYAAAGALLGTLGSGLYRLISPDGAFFVLQTLAAVLMVGIGLYLAGWFPRFAVIERIGVPLWRRLQPFTQRLLPVRSLPQALLYGLVWGWLPCGLVYSALLLTITQGGPLAGGLFMLAFGVGTLPAIIGAGILTGSLVRLTRHPRVRQAAGLALIALALTGLLFAEQLHLVGGLPNQESTLQCTP